MVVYSYDNFREEIKELHSYIKETDKFFVKANGSRDAKITSYSFLSLDKDEVKNHVIAKYKNRVESLLKKVSEFEEKKKRDFEILEKNLKDTISDYEKIKIKIEGK